MQGYSAKQCLSLSCDGGHSQCSPILTYVQSAPFLCTHPPVPFQFPISKLHLPLTPFDVPTSPSDVQITPFYVHIGPSFWPNFTDLNFTLPGKMLLP